MDSGIVKELTGVLIKNIDASIIKEKNIDLILSGGAFNASYLIGCLYFIREMCEKGWESLLWKWLITKPFNMCER